MIFRVVFLRSAENDLMELKTYILKYFDIRTWHASYSKIKETIETLKAFPLAGKYPEEFASLNLAQYRQAISGENRVIYEVRQQTVYIHLICDCRKDLAALLTRRLLQD